MQFKYLQRAPFVLALSCLAVTAGIANADVVAKPDANTLWREDGASAPLGENSAADHWNGSLDIKSVNGKLELNASDEKKISTGRYVQTDAQYPYLSWRIDEFDLVPGYQGFSIFFSGKSPSLHLVKQIKPGTYVLDMGQFLKTPQETSYLALYLYGGRLTMMGLAMSKAPENRIEIAVSNSAKKNGIAIGDEVKFTVCLAEDSEDVTLSFFDSYTLPQLKINGQQSLQLRPEGENYKRWSGTIKLQSIENLAGDLFGKTTGDIPIFRIVARATILGGAFKEPLWTALPYPIHLGTPKIEE